MFLQCWHRHPPALIAQYFPIPAKRGADRATLRQVEEGGLYSHWVECAILSPVNVCWRTIHATSQHNLPRIIGRDCIFAPSMQPRLGSSNYCRRFSPPQQYDDLPVTEPPPTAWTARNSTLYQLCSFGHAWSRRDQEAVFFLGNVNRWRDDV